MIVYDGVKTDFLKSVEEDTIALEIENNIRERMKWHVARNEFRSWENSLKHMYIVLNDSEIPDDAGVAIEYNIPQTSKRVDFMISGYDSEKTGNVVIIELKQWEQLEAIEGRDGLVRTYLGHALRDHPHPSYQALTYAKLIWNFNRSVQEKKICLHPCSYLHNYRRADQDPLDACQYETYLQDSPAFTKGQVSDLRQFIKKDIVFGDENVLIRDIDNGKIRPSKSLQDEIAGMLKGNQEFDMIDDQKVAYENILMISRKSKTDSKKRVVIVKGGPGTGKTVVAVNLLVQLTNEDQYCQYVSKNSAPRNVYQKKLKGEIKKSIVDNLFKGSGVFVDAQENMVDTLLVDEAHRLNEKSGMFQNQGENQIKEIIQAAKCSVFFIDEHQRVTTSDIGSVEEIKKWSEIAGAEIFEQELVSQFRCNGSDGYLAWVDQVLEIRETANYDLDDIDYDIKILDSPNEMRDIIIEKNRPSNRARILAGYCWEWDRKMRSRSEYHDIKIGDFEISWNLGNSSTYAIDENSVNEAGCIHTAQGLEFDYVGVIIGEDMRYENEHVITDFTKRAHTDQSLKGIKKMYKTDPEKAMQLADEIIRNTYRTLMTRGMKGCYIYCVDKALAEYLKERI